MLIDFNHRKYIQVGSVNATNALDRHKRYMEPNQTRITNWKYRSLIIYSTSVFLILIVDLSKYLHNYILCYRFVDQMNMQSQN